jgi:hypothetical protein
MRRRFGSVAFVLVTGAFQGEAIAADLRSYNFSLETRSGEPQYAVAVSPKAARRYDVFRDAQGRITRVARYQGGKKISDLSYHFSEGSKLPGGYDFFAADGELTAKVKIRRNDKGERIRQDYFSPSGELLEYTIRTYSADGVDSRNHTAQGKVTRVLTMSYSPSGLLTWERSTRSGGAVEHERTYDEKTGLAREGRQFRDGLFSHSMKYSYDSTGTLTGTESFDQKGRRFAVRSFNDGLLVVDRYDFRNGSSKEIRLSYDEKRRIKEADLYFSARHICRFTYERLVNGRVVRTTARAPSGEVLAEYPDAEVINVSQNGQDVDGRPGVIHKRENWW